MLTINILPEHIKKELNFLGFYNAIKRIILVLFLMTILIAATVLFGKIILKIQADVLLDKSAIVQNVQKSSGKEDEMEKELQQVIEIQDDSMSFSPIIDSLMSFMSEDISLSQMKIDKIANQITLIGVAKTRESLLNFKKALEDSKKYTDLDFPIKNLLEKENINFNIKMNIKSL